MLAQEILPPPLNLSKDRRIAGLTPISEYLSIQFLIDSWNEAEPYATLQRMAWGLSEISQSTGLSVAFLRAEVRAGRLPVRRFGRRVLVRDDDLKHYLSRGSERKSKAT